uniref:Fibronectin type-III domain-containing protein n=1 Tax=Caenorhabditis tropicalis TaxID=1561998 RepID=A0A1I7UIG3_9PELO
MISSGWMQEMEPIPEEGTEADGSEWGATSDGGTGRRTMRKKEVYTSEQINTLVRLVFWGLGGLEGVTSSKNHLILVFYKLGIQCCH